MKESHEPHMEWHELHQETMGMYGTPREAGEGNTLPQQSGGHAHQQEAPMRVSVFGLGYVGCVTAACLAHDGHRVIGVDVNPRKVDSVASGRSPIAEPGLDRLLEKLVHSGSLAATTDSASAVRASDVSLVCVGTPSNGNGSLNLLYAEKVCREIGLALADKPAYHTVVIRSTVLPGTVEERLIPILEASSGKRAGAGFGVCMNPEFLREGRAIDDYYHPSQVVVGELDARSGQAVRTLYAAVQAPMVATSIRTAEMVKYVSNAFHAVKIAFANEIGNLCADQGIDGSEVMEIFAADRKLNVSPAYLRPGFAFGGSCLPKDLRALLYKARVLDAEVPLLGAVLASNQRQIQRAVELVERTGCKKIGVLGLAFKAGTDDVRESPAVPLVETLIGRGYQVSVFDDGVDPERLIGANRSYLERELPHIASIMRPSIQQLLDEADVLVVTNNSPSFQHLRHIMRRDQQLIDLVGGVAPDLLRGEEHEEAA
jgi:GDP-mannose 6-dehydrogenase